MTNDRNIIRLLLMMAVVFAGVMVSLPAYAQYSGPCSDTVERYCKDVTPGGGRIIQCLKANKEDLSIACKDWIEDQQKSLKELNAACTQEIVLLCNFDTADNIRVYRCLESNYQGLLSPCKDKLREIRERFQ